MANFVHYLKRFVGQPNYLNPNHSWFARNQPDDQGFSAPSFHVTRSINGAAERVEEGDRIWLFSALRSSSWGSAPVGLDAMIVVSRIHDLRTTREDGQPAFVYHAGEGSAWFPLYDASPYLSVVETINGKGEEGKLILDAGANDAGLMRQMRQVADPAPLERLANAVRNAERHFVSYRLLDGTRSSFAKCKTLVKGGKAVWWDRWSLPRRMAERREILSDTAMTTRIFREMAACDLVWGIETMEYGVEGSYSADEKRNAIELGKYRSCQIEP